MTAPFPDARNPEKMLPDGLTVDEAITRWRETHVAGERPAFPEPLLAPGELHGVMARMQRRRPRGVRRPEPTPA